MGLARSEEPVPGNIPLIPIAQLWQELQGSDGKASPFSQCQEGSMCSVRWGLGDLQEGEELEKG